MFCWKVAPCLAAGIAPFMIFFFFLSCTTSRSLTALRRQHAGAEARRADAAVCAARGSALRGGRLPARRPQRHPGLRPHRRYEVIRALRLGSSYGRR
jgi:hypothetical protein